MAGAGINHDHTGSHSANFPRFMGNQEDFDANPGDGPGYNNGDQQYSSYQPIGSMQRSLAHQHSGLQPYYGATNTFPAPTDYLYGFNDGSDFYQSSTDIQDPFFGWAEGQQMGGLPLHAQTSPSNNAEEVQDEEPSQLSQPPFEELFPELLGSDFSREVETVVGEDDSSDQPSAIVNNKPQGASAPQSFDTTPDNQEQTTSQAFSPYGATTTPNINTEQSASSNSHTQELGEEVVGPVSNAVSKANDWVPSVTSLEAAQQWSVSPNVAYQKLDVSPRDDYENVSRNSAQEAYSLYRYIPVDNSNTQGKIVTKCEDCLQSDAEREQVLSHCFEVIRMIIELHEKGVAVHLLDRKKRENGSVFLKHPHKELQKLKCSERVKKVQLLVRANKNFAYDLVLGRNLFSLVWSPTAAQRVKAQNADSNENRAKNKKKIKAENEALQAKIATLTAGGNTTPAVAPAVGVMDRPITMRNGYPSIPAPYVETQGRVSPTYDSMRTGNGFDVNILQWTGTGTSQAGMSFGDLQVETPATYPVAAHGRGTKRGSGAAVASSGPHKRGRRAAPVQTAEDVDQPLDDLADPSVDEQTYGLDRPSTRHAGPADLGGQQLAPFVSATYGSLNESSGNGSTAPYPAANGNGNTA